VLEKVTAVERVADDEVLFAIGVGVYLDGACFFREEQKWGALLFEPLPIAVLGVLIDFEDVRVPAFIFADSFLDDFGANVLVTESFNRIECLSHTGKVKSG